jgi:hypothetical protein
MRDDLLSNAKQEMLCAAHWIAGGQSKKLGVQRCASQSLSFFSGSVRSSSFRTKLTASHRSSPTIQSCACFTNIQTNTRPTSLMRENCRSRARMADEQQHLCFFARSRDRRDDHRRPHADRPRVTPARPSRSHAVPPYTGGHVVVLDYTPDA